MTAAAVCGLFAFASASSAGQTPAAGTAGSGTPAIVGTGVFTPMVENMDRSLAFYHDVFDMDVPPMPASGMRPYNQPNPRLFLFFNIPGAKERHQSARVKGTRIAVEAMEVQNVDHTTIPLRVQDPGAATLVLVVRDVDAALARVTQANYPVVTTGGKPVTLADGSRAVLVRDVDNRFIELRQPATLPETTAPATSNIIDMRVSIAVNDMARTEHVYRDVLGFTLGGDTPFRKDKAMQALTGLSRAEVRTSRVQAQGSALWLEFVEFKGVDRTPLHMRIQDRGAARLQLRTRNIDGMVAAVKAAGLQIVTVGGGSQPIPPNFKGSLVADPNNFFVSLFESCDGCAPRVQAAAH
ncbi:MAG TPA: VOC family protein [Vicinamibacterales bacterium]|nr:VOC family protein [Vicinamibacterales bacterium]